MTRFAVKAAIAALLLLAVGAVAGGARAEEGEGAVVVALVPEQNVFLQIKRYRPLQDYLSATTGVPFRFTVMSSYYDAFRAISNGKAQAAVLGSLAALLAVEQEKAQLVVRPLWKGGVSTYRALIIARKDANIRSAADLMGKRYAYVSTLSTAGWLFDRAFLGEKGITSPGTYLGMTIFAGSHDVVIDAVYKGHVDAGGCKDLVWERKRQEYSDLTEKVVIIARSQPLPDNTLVASRTMPAAQQAALRDALLGMNSRQDGQAALEEMGAMRFIPTERSEFEYLRGLLRKMGIDPQTYSGHSASMP